MRLSIQIVLFMIFLNAGAGLLQGMGVDEDLGIQPETGDSKALNDAVNKSEDYDTGAGGGSTLFELYNSLAGVVETIANAVFPARVMLDNAGVPSEFVDFLFAGATLYTAMDLIGFLRSGGLTQ